MSRSTQTYIEERFAEYQQFGIIFDKWLDDVGLTNTRSTWNPSMTTSKERATHMEQSSEPIGTFVLQTGKGPSIIVSSETNQDSSTTFGSEDYVATNLSITGPIVSMELVNFDPPGQTVTFRILTEPAQSGTARTLRTTVPITLHLTQSQAPSSQLELDSDLTQRKQEDASKCEYHQWDPHLKFCVRCGKR